MPRNVTLTVALAVLFVLGLVIGRWSSWASEEVLQREASRGDQSSASDATTPNLQAAGADSADNPDEASRFDAHLAKLRAVSKMSVPELMDELTVATEAEDYTVSQAIFWRLVELDSEALFDWASRQAELPLRMFYLLARHDPESALNLGWSFPQKFRERLWGAALVQLSEEDAAAAWRRYNELGLLEDPRSYPPSQLLVNWLEQDEATALATLRTLQPHRKARNASNSLLYQLARNDPNKAIALLNDNSLPLREHMANTVFRIVAENDLDLAIRHFADLNANHRNHAASAIAGILAEQEVDAAFAFAESLNGAARLRAESAVINKWLHDDAQGAKAFFANGASPRLMRQSAHQLGRMLARHEGTLEALTWASQHLGGHLQRNAISGVLNEINSAAPEVRGALMQLPPGSIREMALNRLFDNWPRNDLDGALEWAETHFENPREQRKVSRLAMKELIGHDALAAFERFAWDLRDDGEGLTADPNIVRDLADQLASQAPTVALDWLNRLPATRLGEVASKRVLQSIGTNDPGMLEEVIATTQDPGLAKQARSAWLETVVEHDPRAAADYLAANPDAPNAANAMGQLAHHWFMADPAGAHAWLETVPDGQGFDNAVNRLAHNFRSTDPGYAFNWVLMMSPGETQTNQLRSLLSEWSRHDPEGAASALSGTDLSEELTNELKQIVGRGH
ncbi:MAG: hypothetical protein ACFB21_04745 [Opitutales bacterium]